MSALLVVGMMNVLAMVLVAAAVFVGAVAWAA
jgi:hypothetical protein